jgi:hypothetical protein
MVDFARKPQALALTVAGRVRDGRESSSGLSVRSSDSIDRVSSRFQPSDLAPEIPKTLPTICCNSLFLPARLASFCGGLRSTESPVQRFQRLHRPMNSRKPIRRRNSKDCRSLRQGCPGLLRCHICCVPVRPVRVALPVALLVLAVGGFSAAHRACQIVC